MFVGVDISGYYLKRPKQKQNKDEDLQSALNVVECLAAFTLSVLSPVYDVPSWTNTVQRENVSSKTVLLFGSNSKTDILHTGDKTKSVNAA